MSDTPTFPPIAEHPMNRLAKMWTTATEHTLDSVLAANRATIAAVGLADDTREEAEAEAVAFNDRSWRTERSIVSPGTVSIGDRVEFSKSITEEDLERFALASGDTNRLHLDEEFAARTRFGGRVVHGTLVMGLVSAALARLPGLTIYLSQDQRFLAPAKIGDEVRAVCEVVEDLGDRTYRVATHVFNQSGENLVEGEAVVLIDDLPE